jgi:hypothetical protein
LHALQIYSSFLPSTPIGRQAAVQEEKVAAQAGDPDSIFEKECSSGFVEC